MWYDGHAVSLWREIIRSVAAGRLNCRQTKYRTTNPGKLGALSLIILIFVTKKRVQQTKKEQLFNKEYLLYVTKILSLEGKWCQKN